METRLSDPAKQDDKTLSAASAEFTSIDNEMMAAEKKIDALEQELMSAKDDLAAKQARRTEAVRTLERALQTGR